MFSCRMSNEKFSIFINATIHKNTKSKQVMLPQDSGRVLFQKISFPFLILIISKLCQVSQHNTVNAINNVLDLNGTFPYLIDSSTGKVIEPRDYMDFENLYAPNETYKLRQTAQGRNYHLIKAFDFANYYQSDYWHYSRRSDLERSAQPVASVSDCAKHLDWLESQLNRSRGEVLFRPGEQHVNLMNLVDSYGHPETATYYGHAYWLGSYYECTRVSIDRVRFQLEECLAVHDATTCAANQVNQNPSDLSSLKFRYCIGKARDFEWPTSDNYVPKISYKVGLCLPETCETLSFERHAKQIERLMRFNMAEYTRERIQLADMYCVPDHRSPIRQLSLSAKVFLTICSIWLVALIFATFFYSCYKSHLRDLSEIRRATNECCTIENEQLDETQLMSNEPIHQVVKSANGISKLVIASAEPIDMLVRNTTSTSTTNNIINNIDDTNLLASARNDSCQAHRTKTIEPLVIGDACQATNNNIDDSDENNRAKCKKSNRSNLSRLSSAKSINSLSAWLSESPCAIKVLQAMSIKETLREFQQPPKMLELPGAGDKLRVNLNALDAIKCLCCILVIFGHIIFIHMQHLSNIVHTIEQSYGIGPRLLCAFFNFVDTFFIISGMLTAYFIFKRFNKRTFSNPLTWISISLMRLLRLSPVYILVFWFIKTTSVYLTHGPIWDYGTDEKSIKGLCMNDYWWKSILYFGNVGTMQPLCILPAWSIIVDAQYSLIMPAILFLIFKHKRIGYLLLLLATIVSSTKMTLQLADQTAVKTSDMAKIRLHVYPLISRFAAEFYNTAWNRIGPVAIGIFGGHMLYLYEINTIQKWPKFMRGLTFKFVLLLHVFIFLLPTIGLFVDDPESPSETDTTIFILSNATIKPIWSIIQTILLLRLITDLRSHSVLARLMSHNIWHCLGKLCFTSYLIHYEIILTMLKSRQEGLIDPNWSNALREFSAVFMISTVISYGIYILYEAPLNKLIILTFLKKKQTSKECC